MRDDRVLVHIDNRCQIDRRRQTLTLSDFAHGDGPANFGRHRLVDRHGLDLVDFTDTISTILDSTNSVAPSRGTEWQ